MGESLDINIPKTGSVIEKVRLKSAEKDCPTFTSVSETLYSNLLEYKNSAEEIDSTMTIIIAAITKMTASTASSIPNISPSSNIYDLYKNAKLLEKIPSRKAREARATQLLREANIIVSDLRKNIDISYRKVEILSYNLSFEIFKSEFNQFYFPSGESELKFLKNLDLDRFQKNMESLMNIYNKVKDNKGFNVNIIILASGFADENPLSQKKLLSLLSDEERSGLSLKEQQDKGNLRLSELRAITVNNYIQEYLSKYNMFDRLKVCLYGFGTQLPDQDMKNNTINDPERRIVKCFYHIVAAD